MKKIKSVLTTGAVLAVPLAGIAHPGHGETEGFSIIHYFTEPVHATVTVGLIVAIVFMANYFRRKKSQDKKA